MNKIIIKFFIQKLFYIFKNEKKKPSLLIMIMIQRFLNKKRMRELKFSLYMTCITTFYKRLNKLRTKVQSAPHPLSKQQSQNKELPNSFDLLFLCKRKLPTKKR